MPALLRIGLTGGIASGKSTAAQRFVELGIPVIDADEASRRVVARGEPGLARVVSAFGEDILTPAGELDRRALRDLIFADPRMRKKLEAILHPLIRADMEKHALTSAGPYLIMAIPLLVEGDAASRRLDRILVVDAPEEVQLSRLATRDGSSMEQGRAILAAQASREARLALADDVLVNSGSVSDLRQAVNQIHQQYLSIAASLPSSLGT